MKYLILLAALFVCIPAYARSCPKGMVEVKGDYCPNLLTTCLYNVDIDGHPVPTPEVHGNKDANLWACGEFKYPTQCLSKDKDLVHMDFCMDKYEWPNVEGELPEDWLSYYDAKKEIEATGKRLCTANEWTLAAEGPSRKPLPYGDGYHRSKVCNFDNRMPKGLDVFAAKGPSDRMAVLLRGFLVPSGLMEDCVSDYGVHDMAGNIDEWVFNEHGFTTAEPYISGLKGGHIWHVRNASRSITVSHNMWFNWYETGTRACKDIDK